MVLSEIGGFTSKLIRKIFISILLFSKVTTKGVFANSQKHGMRDGHSG